MADEFDAVSQHDLRADMAERADPYPSAQSGTGIDNGGRMNDDGG
jgi:hypothetical protein